MLHPILAEAIKRVRSKTKNEIEELSKAKTKQCLATMHCSTRSSFCENCSEAKYMYAARYLMIEREIEALGYTVKYSPPSVSFSDESDYQFVHNDYDGPGDPRCGCGPDLESCLERIKEIEAECNE